MVYVDGYLNELVSFSNPEDISRALGARSSIYPSMWVFVVSSVYSEGIYVSSFSPALVPDSVVKAGKRRGRRGT